MHHRELTYHLEALKCELTRMDTLSELRDDVAQLDFRWATEFAKSL